MPKRSRSKLPARSQGTPQLIRVPELARYTPVKVHCPAAGLVIPRIHESIRCRENSSLAAGGQILHGLDAAGLLQQCDVDLFRRPSDAVQNCIRREFPQTYLLKLEYREDMTDWTDVFEGQGMPVYENREQGEFGCLFLERKNTDFFLIDPTVGLWDKACPGFFDMVYHYTVNALSHVDIAWPGSLQDCAHAWYWQHDSYAEALKNDYISDDHFFTDKADKLAFPKRFTSVAKPAPGAISLTRPPKFGTKKVRGHRLDVVFDMVRELHKLNSGFRGGMNHLHVIAEEHCELTTPYVIRNHIDDCAIDVCDEMWEVAQQCSAELDKFWALPFLKNDPQHCGEALKQALMVSKISELGGDILHCLLELEDRQLQ